jgi:hypothetical protein
MELTLTRRRTGKTGWVSYKATARRSGAIYLSPKMYSGDPPETITLIGEGLAVAASTEVPVSAAEAGTENATVA